MTLSEPTTDLSHIDYWIFDLDNTLYPVTDKLLAHIDTHMSGFVANFLSVDAEEARRIQKSYFRKYGLTLRGLMIHHGLDPVRYFEEMKQMDLTEVDPNPALGAAIADLPGRKLIYTNSSRHHTEMVLDRLEFGDIFDGVFDITAADYVPKPAVEAYRKMCDLHAIDPARALMVDDIARNLEPAAALGMTTVWMQTGAEWAKDVTPEAHIHSMTRDIMEWVTDTVAIRS